MFYCVENEKFNKRIILLSDIHYYNHREKLYLDKVLIKLKKMEYDYLCISGDLLDYSRVTDQELLLEWLSELGKLSKVIISLGNHDLTNDRKKHIYDFDQDLFDKIRQISNVIVLDNEIYVDGNIRFIGLTLPIDFYYQYKENEIYFMRYVNNIFPKSFDNKYNILLCHSPKSLTNVKTYNMTKLMRNIQLVLCGHMHAGITPVWLRKILKGRGLIGPFKQLFPKNAYGHLELNNTNIIISSGITTASNCNRFSFLDPLFAREITVIDLMKKEKE